MRTTIRTLGIAAAGFVTAIGVASASDPYEQSPEGRAYIGFSFGGGQTIAPRDLHYGLRFDHDSRFGGDQAPAVLQFDFTRAGMNDTRVNGLSVLKHEYRLHQNEGSAPADNPPPAEGSPPADSPPPADNPPPVESGAPAEAPPPAEAAAAPAAAPAEEEGFFSGMWHGVTHFFSGLFGGNDEEKPAEGTAKSEPPAAEPAAAPAEASAGGMGAIDWGLLAVGVAGVAVAGSGAVSGKETPDAGQPGGVGGTSGGTSGGTTGCVATMVTPVCVPYSPTPYSTPYDARSNDPEYQKWLDGGTGHMGDLGG